MRVAVAALFLTFAAGSAMAVPSHPFHPPKHDPHGAPAPLIGAGAPLLLAGAGMVASKLLRRKR